MKSHQTTILDIAKQLNMSKSTVSRALTNHPNINSETKRKVLELAEKLDYQRNMLALNLATNKSYTLGIIVPEIVSSFFSKIIVAAQNEASKAGYNIITCQSNESYETEVRNSKIMLANQIDGLLIAVTKETKKYDHLMVFQRKGYQ